MRGLSHISVIAAAFAGLTLSACSEKPPEPQPTYTPEPTPEPKVYIPPTPREVRDAFETVAKSNAAPISNPAGNSFYKVAGDAPLRDEADAEAKVLRTIGASLCLNRIDGADSHAYAKVDVVGQNIKGWVAKRALRPAPECTKP